ncbi:MAG: chemotaxis protein CheB [Desulfobacterium sp.]|nr:chemotaxis protein CheB [Desulfobacterium sp.]MBU3949486.1 chemotaxis protein CheB [Pseudomonadota bacterium]MBU4037890.1 chemotaxis protein CheB [Pseudomonadota bacterium]
MRKLELDNKYEAVVIGASVGGIEALRVIFAFLPAAFKQTIIVVLHLSPQSSGLAQILSRKFRMIIKEAEEKEKIKGGVVYTAPPNYHLMIEDDKTFSLSVSEQVNYARPSIDVLFETAADVYRESLIGIILTGGNKDGSQGLKKIKELGGLAIVQDPDTAEGDSMPRNAIAVSEVDHILTLDKIGLLLSGWLRQ